jgi:hypothetical protein
VSGRLSDPSPIPSGPIPSSAAEVLAELDACARASRGHIASLNEILARENLLRAKLSALEAFREAKS